MSSDTDVFVARQPIMDRSGRVIAYELLFRDGQVGAARIDDDMRCTTAVIERTMGSIGLTRLAGSKVCFLNCPHDFLFSDFPDVLPAQRFVLEILESVELTPGLARRCRELQGAGFQIALDDVRTLSDDILSFLPSTDIVKIDWPFLDPAESREMVSQLKRAGKVVLAEKIESAEDAEMALQLGCDLLQGYYFAKPQLMSGKRARPPVKAILQIFALVENDAPLSTIAKALRDAPFLVTQLLRLANNSEQPNGKTERISSLRQALSITGSRRLLHWCGLLLYSNREGLDASDDPLVLLAQRRAHFMEHAVDSIPGGKQSLVAGAYLTGMLSLLHAAYHVEQKSFLDELPVSDSIRAAILEGAGVLGKLLSAANLLEAKELDEALGILDRLAVSPSGIRRIIECY
ncbi:EAL domain-containing protein [Paraburkholderia phytofirmans]|uniref:EAL and HDOD domain-containing protein n=1 Tax=Paraburkholderia phytofirmans TaxID=261302 RepID=UPI0038BC255E